MSQAAKSDMPLQILDRAGLRVGKIKPEYLELVHPKLHRHFKELGINIQIPLPLIRGRSGFEHEAEYLHVIQKYVAIEIYKAVAYKALTQEDPKFLFEGFPRDWETNDAYWKSFDFGDKAFVKISNTVNGGDYSDISAEDLKVLLTAEDKMDFYKKYVKLILMMSM